MHQKSVILYGLEEVEFGSGNWTESSAHGQDEHLLFTKKPWMVAWFIAQFNRKWNNEKTDGTPIPHPSVNGVVSPYPMFKEFVPLAPEKPISVSPAQGAVNVPRTMTLRWEGVIMRINMTSIWM